MNERPRSRGVRQRALGLMAAVTTLAVAAGVVPPVAGTVAASPARPSAVVVMYHRFGEEALPSTNIRIAQFESHLAELAAGGYSVLGLPEITAALASNKALPARTVGISIDDAYLSVYREAWPRLRRAGLPFTLFVATEPIDRGSKGYMSWDQIRELANAGVTIGSQTANHPHMPVLSRASARAELAKSNARFEAELGFKPKLFAYPFGEASLVTMDVVREAGFTFAFGQHSGVLHGKANRLYLPRFALNEHYGDLKRFRLAANALPLFATEVTPADPTLGPNPPAFGFTVGASVGGLQRLACYSSQHGRLEIERLGARRIEVRPPSAFPPGRARINCTSPGGGGRWHWFGTQFFVPRPGTASR